MRIAQILNDRVHWVFDADTIPDWPPDPDGNPIVLVDITNLEANEGDPWPLVEKSETESE